MLSVIPRGYTASVLIDTVSNRQHVLTLLTDYSLRPNNFLRQEISVVGVFLRAKMDDFVEKPLRIILDEKQYQHFEECMTTPTTTATGMVTAAAEMLEFSKLYRRS